MELSEFEKRVSELSVLVVGDAMVDVDLHANFFSQSYEGGGQILKEQKVVRYPGGAANVAMNLRSLGARVNLLAPIGSDEAGRWLIERLWEEKIEWVPKWFSASGKWLFTTTKTRVYQDGKPLCRIDRDATNVIPENLLTSIITEGQYDLVVISDYQKGALSINPQMWINPTKKKPKRTVITANAKPELVGQLKGLELLTVNDIEFKKIRQDGESEKALLKRLGVLSLLHTKGEEGLVVLDRMGGISSILPHRCSFKDPVGAGDACFAAASLAFAMFPVGSVDMGFIGEVANAAGAAKCQLQGTKPVRMADIKGFLKHRLLSKGLDLSSTDGVGSATPEQIAKSLKLRLNYPTAPISVTCGTHQVITQVFEERHDES